MLNRCSRVWWLGLGSWVALSLWMVSPPAAAQGFLEQLEQRVRSGLELNGSSESQPPSSSTSELPAPTTDSARRTPPPPPTPPTGAGDARSILDAPLIGTDTRPPAAPPTDSSQATAPPVTDAKGGVYLGLEAEAQAGGGLGVRVTRVTENSPAWRAGFKLGDTILAIDGFAISDLDTMVERLSLRKAGDTIRVLLLRGNKNVELTAVLQDSNLAQRIHGIAPDNLPPSTLAPVGGAWLGVVVADLSTAFRNQFGLRTYRAAAVTNVTKGSPADTLGIMPGDAIVGADSRPIESARELLAWMATKRPGEVVSLNVMRGARTRILETVLANDGRSPVAAQRPPVADPFAPVDFEAPPAEVALDNTVPVPSAAEPVEVDQLLGELRQARQQLLTLEQRVAELESLLREKK